MLPFARAPLCPVPSRACAMNAALGCSIHPCTPGLLESKHVSLLQALPSAEVVAEEEEEEEEEEEAPPPQRAARVAASRASRFAQRAVEDDDEDDEEGLTKSSSPAFNLKSFFGGSGLPKAVSALLLSFMLPLCILT